MLASCGNSFQVRQDAAFEAPHDGQDEEKGGIDGGTLVKDLVEAITGPGRCCGIEQKEKLSKKLKNGFQT